MNKTFFLFIFLSFFLTSCSKKWVYTVNPIVVKNKGKESILYPHLYEKYSKYCGSLYGGDLCVLFENSMINTDVLVFNSERGKLFNFTIENKSNNNICKLLYIPNASTDVMINLNNSSYFLKADTHRKFTFLIIKKRNNKFILTFTNKINYRLYEKQLTCNSENTSEK